MLRKEKFLWSSVPSKYKLRCISISMCPTNDGVEDTEHFLLLCPSFVVQRQNLLAEILPLLRPFGYANLSNEVLAKLLLYGDENLPNDVNRNILELTLRFIKETGRLD